MKLLILSDILRQTPVIERFEWQGEQFHMAHASPQGDLFQYVSSYLPNDATPEHPDGQVAFAYELPAPAKSKSPP